MLVLIVSSFLMAYSGSLLVGSLMVVARALRWREFVVGFVIMAFATSAPNLFVGITSAIKGIPELSFGDVIGGNTVDLTLGLALGVLIGGGIIAESRMVQSSALFMLGIAVLPMLLVMDGELGRLDGLILISTFFLYSFWLFSKEERFRKVYEGNDKISPKLIIKSIFLFLAAITILIVGSQGVVRSALYFAGNLNLPLGLIGILIVGLGNSLPEIYFTIISAKKGEDWLVLGNMMGGIITCASFILGLVIIIHPIKIVDFSPYIIGRLFLVIAAISLFVFLKTGKKLTRQEGLVMLLLYVCFLTAEVFLR